MLIYIPFVSDSQTLYVKMYFILGQIFSTVWPNILDCLFPSFTFPSHKPSFIAFLIALCTNDTY